MKDRVKQIREYFGLSQAQFARKIDRTSGFIANVETGRVKMSDDTVDVVSRIFGVDRDWLVFGTGEMFSSGKETVHIDREGACNRVKMIRKHAGLTQENFALSIGYSRMLIHFIEVKESMPTNEFLSKVSSVYEVSYNWLLTGEGEQKAGEAVVDDKLIEWLKKNPEVVRRLRIESGLE